MPRVICLVVVCFLGNCYSANAQEFTEYYTVQHPDEFHINWKEFYREATAQTAKVKESLPNHLDMSYGDHRKQKLDLYLPKGQVKNAPVHLFIHGGGKQEGDKAQYGFVAAPFAAHGIITAVMSYRLVGWGEEVVYPDQENDVKQAVIWLYNNVAKYGGNPREIFISGHSNGAHLAARVGVDRSWLGEAGISSTIVKGFASLSGGTRDLTNSSPDYSVGNAYAPSEELKIMTSPIYHVNNPPAYVLLQYGAEEASEERSQGIQRLKNALIAKGTEVHILIEDGQDHDGAVMVLGQENSKTFERMLEMIHPGT